MAEDLRRARAAVVEAELAEQPSDRFLAGASGRPAGGRHRAGARGPIRRDRAQRARPRNAWELLAEVAPEFGEWAAFFAATEGKRDAVQAGAPAIVSAREADDLVRDA